MLVQRDAIFERAIHSLAVERHHGVRGIADQQRAAVEPPMVQTQGAQAAGWIGDPIGIEIRNAAERVSKIPFEQVSGRSHARQRRKTGLACIGQEQGDRKCLFGIWQRDAHVTAARPDVQRVGVQLEATIGIGRHFQFLVAMAERLETLAQFDPRLQCRAYARAGAIGADQHSEIQDFGTAVVVVDDAQLVLVKIDLVQSRIETDARTRRLGRVQQTDVEPATVHRPDHFGIILAIAQQLGGAIQRMQHAPTHHHRLRHHRVL